MLQTFAVLKNYVNYVVMQYFVCINARKNYLYQKYKSSAFNRLFAVLYKVKQESEM